MKRAIIAAAVVILALVAVLSSINPSHHSTTAQNSPSPSPVAPGAIASNSVTATLEADQYLERTPTGALVVDVDVVDQALASIPTATSVALGYDRDSFGARWADEDRNGCDTRNDVLARDLSGATFKPGTHDCVVLSGTLANDYTGSTIHFVRGNDTSRAVEIDHMAPLSYAWQHGANAWSPEQRQKFANDPMNLKAVDGPANSAKGDSGPGQWMPENVSYDCE